MILENLIDKMMESKALFEIALALLFVYYALMTAAQWKLFTKAGEKGWKSLIPFYNIFVSHHLIGMSHIWFILDIIFWVFEIVLELISGTPVLIEEIFFSVAMIFTILSEIIHIFKLCYCYTKSELFGIGLFVIPPLFSMILAFGKSEYNPPLKRRKKNDPRPSYHQ